MTDTITTPWNGATYNLRAGTYWHAVRSDTHLLHNVHLGQGVTHSVSFLRDHGVAGAVTHYGLVNSDSSKELIWEKTRKLITPDSPTRLHALYLFDDKKTAEGRMPAGLMRRSPNGPRTRLSIGRAK